MSDKEKEALEDDEIIVVMTDDEGNEYYYRQEMILPVNGENFALLVPTVSDDEAEGHEHGDGCCCGCDDEDEAFFAKIVPGEDGEDEYIEPTDEEFDAVCAAYDALVDEEDKD